MAPHCEATIPQMEKKTPSAHLAPINRLSGLLAAFLAKQAPSVRTKGWDVSLEQTACVQLATLVPRAKAPT